MLWNASAINGYDIDASDGEIGTVCDLLFEDGSWAIRWLVVETGSWFLGRKVLLPTSVLGQPDPKPERLPVRLTREQVKEAPVYDPDALLTREVEIRLHGYQHVAPSWEEPAMQGFYARRVSAMSGDLPAPGDRGHDAPVVGNPHLHSVSVLKGLPVEGSDDAIGHVEDLLIDTSNWTVRYMSVHTGVWWPGATVLISPLSVEWIDWIRGDVQLDISTQKVKESPPYSPLQTVDGAYDETFLTYYGVRWVKK